MRHALALCGFLALAAAPTSASVEPDHVLLARIWASELGWDEAVEEVAIWQVLEQRRHWIGVHRGSPITLRQAMRAYSPRATGARLAPAGARQRWVQGLRGDGERSVSWRAPLVTIRWSSVRARWEARLDRARARIAGTDPRPSPCADVPDHWSSRRHWRDLRSAARAVSDGRWAVVDCGGTANAFHRVIRRRR